MLLVSGGLFLRSLDRARQIELGFDPNNLVVASVIPAENGYDAAQRLDYYTCAQPNPRIAGRGTGGWIEWAPLASVSEGGPVWVDGRPPRAGEQAFMATLAAVDADYFSTSQVPILEGRTFDDRDATDSKAGRDRQRNTCQPFWPNQSADRPFARRAWRARRGRRRGAKREVPVRLGIAAAEWSTGRWRNCRQIGPRCWCRSSRDPAGLMAELQRVFRDVDPAVACSTSERWTSISSGRAAGSSRSSSARSYRHLRRGRRAAGGHRPLRDDCGTRHAAHAGVRCAHRPRR